MSHTFEGFLEFPYSQLRTVLAKPGLDNSTGSRRGSFREAHTIQSLASWRLVGNILCEYCTGMIFLLSQFRV